MKLLIDFIPLILFFVSYTKYNMQIAALVLAGATVVQLITIKLIYKKVDKLLIYLTITVVFFSGLTYYFNNPNFLVIKVSLVYIAFAAILLIGQFVFKKLFIKNMLGKEISLPEQIWQKINLFWGLFFIFCTILNLFIAHYYDLDTWVKFKFLGTIGLNVLAIIITIIAIYPYLKDQLDPNNGNLK